MSNMNLITSLLHLPENALQSMCQDVLNKIFRPLCCLLLPAIEFCCFCTLCKSFCQMAYRAARWTVIYYTAMLYTYMLDKSRFL